MDNNGRGWLGQSLRSFMGLSDGQKGLIRGQQAGQSDLSESKKTTPHARKHEYFVGLQPGLPADQILRALRGWRYGRDRSDKNRVPFAVMARLSGVSRQSLYTIVRTGRVSSTHRAKLSSAIEAILEGRLRFKRRGQRWQIIQR